MESVFKQSPMVFNSKKINDQLICAFAWMKQTYRRDFPRNLFLWISFPISFNYWHTTRSLFQGIGFVQMHGEFLVSSCRELPREAHLHCRKTNMKSHHFFELPLSLLKKPIQIVDVCAYSVFLVSCLHVLLVITCVSTEARKVT